MKIGIVGGGIAGSYLAFSLSSKHDVEVYERKTPELLGEDCAWGTSIHMLEKYCSKMNRLPSDYIEHVCKKFISDLFVNRNAVTFNKNKFLLDFLEKGKANVHYEQEVERKELNGFDLVIDATGSRRALLPPAENELEKNWICPCFQMDVKSNELPEDFYFELKSVGLLWVFPLGENKAKVGCGDFVLNPRKEVEEYLSNKNYEITKRVGAKVRVIPPSMSKPFYVDGDPPVLGVGESIGTVSPFSGEGIFPSLICADLLLAAFKRGDSLKEIAQLYESGVLREYTWVDNWFDLVDSVRSKGKIKQLYHLIRSSVPPWACGDVSKLKLALKGFSR